MRITMMKKVTFLVGIGVGYLIGSKEGREKLMQLWNDPKVQDTVQQGTDWAKEKAPGLQEKAQDAVGSAKESAKDAMGQAKESVSGSGSSNSGGSGSSNSGSSGSSTSGGASARPASATAAAGAAGTQTSGGDRPMDPAHPQPETGR